MQYKLVWKVLNLAFVLIKIHYKGLRKCALNKNMLFFVFSNAKFLKFEQKLKLLDHKEFTNCLRLTSKMKINMDSKRYQATKWLTEIVFKIELGKVIWKREFLKKVFLKHFAKSRKTKVKAVSYFCKKLHLKYLTT